MPRLNKQSGMVAQSLVLIVLLVGLVVGLYVLKNPTIFKSKAAKPPILDALKITETGSSPEKEIDCNGAVNPPTCEISSPNVTFTIQDINALVPNNSGPTSNLFQFPKQVSAQENSTKTCAEGNCSACETQLISVCGNQNAYVGDCDYATACKNNPNGKYTCRSSQNPNGCSFDQYDCSLCDASITGTGNNPTSPPITPPGEGGNSLTGTLTVASDIIKGSDGNWDNIALTVSVQNTGGKVFYNHTACLDPISCIGIEGWFALPDGDINDNSSKVVNWKPDVGQIPAGKHTFALYDKAGTKILSLIHVTYRPATSAITVTEMTINDQSITPKDGSELISRIPIADLSKEGDTPIGILVKYSDGASRPFVINFHYKPQGSLGDVIHLTSCQEITKPGNYVLDQDIKGKDGSVCISILNTTEVNLDCNNHSLDGYFRIIGVNNFSVKACRFPRGNYDIAVARSNNGNIISNVIENLGISVSNSSKINFSKNMVSYKYAQKSTNDSIIDSNIFINTNTAGDLISSKGGSGNQIINNILDGKSDGILGNKIGADDGIVLGDEMDITNGEKSAVIKNNTISNVWDCGIETVGLVQSSVITDNKIDNAGNCGIGAWWSSSWVRNTVSNNLVNNAPQLFMFYWNSRIANNNLQQGETVRFKDNTFIKNKFTAQRMASNGNGYDSTAVFFLIDTRVPENKSVRSNNIFSDNDFGLTASPYFKPGSMIVDGGGNICKQGFDNDYPLKCTGSQTGAQFRVLSTQDIKKRVNDTIEAVSSGTRDSDE